MGLEAMSDDDEIRSLRALSEAYTLRFVLATLTGFMLFAVPDALGLAVPRLAVILAMVSFVLLWIYALIALMALFRTRMRLRALRRRRS